MKQIGASELRELPPAVDAATTSQRLRAAAAAFWLQILFFFAQHASWFVRAARPPFVFLASLFSRAIRTAGAANARRILPPDATDADVRRYTRGVVASFYEFVCDVGRSLRLTPADLVARIESIEGHEKYVAARAMKKGAILLTAHMGSFEVAVAGLLAHEKRIHVVFKRDVGRFEHIRQTLRQRLGVVEQPVDDGWGIWMRLRDALREDDVVAIQGDRVMPGQKGVRMPFLGGHLLLPTGPVKLATASGAPIIPVFSVRTLKGRVRLFIEEPIVVGDNTDLAMEQIAAVIAKYVAAYPEQWLVLHPAFCEDSVQTPEDKA